MGLLDEERFLVHHGLGSGRHGRLSLGLCVRGKAGQLAGQGGQLVQGVVHDHILVMVIFIPGTPIFSCPSLVVICVLAEVGQLMGVVVHVVSLVHHHRGGAEVDEKPAAVAQ